MKRIAFLFILTAGLGLFSTSCRDIFEQPAWDVEALVPVFTTSLSIEDLVEDSLIEVNSDQSLKLVYSDEVYTLQLDTLFDFPDTTISVTSPATFGTFSLAPGNPLYSDTSENKYTLSGAELTTAVVRNGSLTASMSNTINEAVLFLYEIPGATKNGQVFSVSRLVPAGSISNPNVQTFSFDLSGYTLDLRGLDGSDFNTLVTRFNAVIDPNGQIVNIPSGTSVQVASTFSNLVPEYVEGFFGNRTEESSSAGEQTDFFDQIKAGTFDVEGLDVSLTIRNGIGVDLTTTLNSIMSINSETNNSVALSHPIIGDPINMNRASASGVTAQSVTSTRFDLELNDGNSNFDELLENQPDRFGFGLEFVLNPLGNVANHHDFFFYDRGIDVFLDVELPLCLIANNLTLTDTSDLELDERDDQLNRIDKGTLYVYAENGYPFDANIQLLLLDSNFVLIDSLVSPNATMLAGQLDAQFAVDQTESSTIPFPLTQDQIDDLFAARYLVTRAAFTTAGQPQHVKIYSNYRISLKAVADFTYRVDEF